MIEPQSSHQHNREAVFINVFVLHQVHLEKCTGADSKVPSFNLNIYEIDLFSLSAKGGARPKQAKPDKVRLTHCIQRLNHYTRLIVPQVNAFDMMPKSGMPQE